MKLIYFTNTYPYGIGEQWKKNEIAEFVNHFEDITVVPFSYGHNRNNPKALPQGVKLLGPLFEQEGQIIRSTDLFSIIFHKYSYAFVYEFLKKRVYRNKRHIISWASTTMNIIRLLSHPVIKNLKRAHKDTVLYFFWGRGTSDMLPFINTKNFRKVFVRMHRFDLFEYANDNYIPYRSALMAKKNVLVAPCSQAGVQHLAELYPAETNHVELVRLGTLSNGKKSNSSNDGVLRIVSCSVLSPVKRVHIMIEALQYISVPVIWRHVGNGAQENELRALVDKLGVADKFIFEGFVNSDDINDLYTGNTFDLFVNTSSSEGVPVSIMEAFAAGIPVLATNVGGTAEIVDERVGGLLPAEISPRLLAEAINAFSAFANDAKQQLRNNAYNRFREMSDSAILVKELVKILKS